MWLTDAGHDHYWLDSWRPSQGTPANIRTNIIFLETSIIDLHFAADSVCLSILIQIFLAGSERIFYFCKSDVSAFQGRDFGAIRKRVYDFQLVHHSNLGPI